MKKQEAIEILKSLRIYFSTDLRNLFKADVSSALTVAIDAVEKELKNENSKGSKDTSGAKNSQLHR